MEYIGKYIIEDGNNYLLRLNKKHLIYFNLILDFVDLDLLEQTKSLKYFYNEIKQEMEEIQNPANYMEE